MTADLIERLRETVANCRNPKPKQLAPEFWPALADEIEEAANALATQERENVAVGEFIDLMTDQIEANSQAHEAILAAKDAALSEMRAELERARKALKPFAKRAKDVTGPGYMTTVKDEWLTAARALASQDEGEER